MGGYISPSFLCVWKMFKKRKNLNFRQRRLSDDEGNGENDTTPSLSNDDDSISFPQPIKKEKKKSKDKGEKKASVLSFEDDLEADDGVVFQEKKSSLSYKLRKEMKKEKKEKQREEKEKKPKKDKNKNGGSTVSELADLGIRIVNGREAEAIAHQPGDSDDDEKSS